ncbi:MAG TPA: tRNA (5-methylaminomethyl-2-thiouridylate)-methyltransferase, partial [Leucothrix sp.]|nr:tRNA (5-methylaminomethyl-2-thiouridylate)-methyltransferase [Leucothrix sp.]
GPLTLLDGSDISAEDIYLAAAITARYSQGRDEEEITVKVGQPGEEEREMQVKPLKADQIEKAWSL